MTETKMRIVQTCSAECGCAYCVVERNGGETVRTAAKRLVDFVDMTGTVALLHIEALREHLK